MSLFKSQYYDKPEGEDYVGKMCAANRLALQGSLGAAVFDIVMFSHPQGFLPTASRFAYWMGPAVGMATAFTTTAYAANRLRGKDDKWNYVAGACASASVFGAWQRSSIQGFSMCLAFSIAACIKKVSIEEGWLFFPKESFKHRVIGGADPAKYDFTLMSQGAKEWTTGNK